jgi:hypothetical protein
MKKILYILFFITSIAKAQTDIDAIMMDKNNLCIGPMYGYNSWKNYWEGTLKRDNQNLGTVSTSMVSIMGNYGISKQLNFLFALPYISTNASAGQFKGMSGLQDISLWLKYEAYNKKKGKGYLSVYTLAGLSTPSTNYVADLLPLSIGLQSTNFSLRGMVDYQLGKWFATGSVTYSVRSNIKLDRTAYYTTTMHYTNEVAMPNTFSSNFRFGYRHNDDIAEIYIDDYKTLGGFDITRNNMPFPSNRMNATRIGAAFKYNTNIVDGLAIVGNFNTTLAGRNIGQSSGYGAGFFYILDFSRKAKSTEK